MRQTNLIMEKKAVRIFTLIEMVAVIAIFTVILGVSALSVGRIFADPAAEGTAGELRSLMASWR